MSHLLGFACLAILWVVVTGPSHTVTARQSSAAPTAAEISQIVDRFLARADAYEKTFRDLVVEETKSIEQYDRTRRVDKRRQIVSDLVVYRSSRGPGADAIEYRDVVSVDGKPVARRGTRAIELIRRASSAKSLDQELSVINRESLRYDLDYRAVGTTMHQGGFTRTSRERFRIEWVGRDQVGGRDVVVLDYREIAPGRQTDPYFAKMGVTAMVPRGRLWLDAMTSQLRRDRWELAGQHPAMPELFGLIRREGTYVDSRFDILVPERIVWEWFDRSGGTKERPTFGLVARSTFVYGAFRQFGVATQETITSPNP